MRGSVAGSAGVELGVYAGTFQSGGSGDGGRRLVASRDERTLRVDADGRFEVTLSPEGGTGNHLRLEPDASSLLIRTYFWDRALRRAHVMPTIERLDVAEPAPALDGPTLLRGLLGAAAFVDGSLGWWNDFGAMKAAPNTLIEMADDGTVQTPSQVRYLSGVVSLAADQALLIELQPRNEPGYWGFTLTNIWGETPDWRFRPVNLNNRELRRSADGRMRIAVAHQRPARQELDWLDASGHRDLFISLRWRGDSALPEVKTRVASLAELA